MDSAAKVRSLDAVKRWCAGAARPLVFTNGVFDLLHLGHVAVLEAARREGETLVVGVNTDRSARGLGKGEGRPIVPEGERARIVAALECVDCAVLFDEPTPIELIRSLQPDVLVKGGDHPAETMVGGELVRAAGGRVVVVPLVPGCSTTDLVERVRGSA